MTTTTTDLRDFGHRELTEAARLLSAYTLNPPTWLSSGIQIVLNTNSGYVFLSDEDYNVAMIDPETKTLAPFISLPYCGEEGFLADLLDTYPSPADLHPDDADCIRMWAENLNAPLPDAWSN